MSKAHWRRQQNRSWQQRNKQARPRIIVTGRHLREISDEALRILERSNRPPSLFVRAGKLCRLRRNENGQPMIEALTESALRGRLERVADFKKNTTGGGLAPALPPMNVVKDILASESWPVPGIAGIVEVPVLRPDGSVLATPGYDSSTRLYYWPKGHLPQIPKNPTNDQVRSATALLDEAIGDFPFLNPASKANALALMLTPIVRPAIRGCVPLALIDAPQQGTGKTLLSKVISLIATGRPAAMMAAPNNDEEWRKRITSTLMGGSTVITIDNLDGNLSSPSLANVLTNDVWQDRILGQSETVEIAQRCTWMVTGNNIRLGGDLQRRCYWIRLDAQSAQPWRGRNFRHPKLVKWVEHNRPALVSALLTLARGWYAAGRPGTTVQPIGSYEDWCEIVGGILAFAGVEGFLGNLDTMYNTADEESEEWVEFLSALETEYRGRSFTTADLIADLNGRLNLFGTLPEELENQRRKPGFGKILGKALAGRADRRYGPAQHHLERDGTRQNATRWRVVSNQAPQGDDGATEAVPTLVC